MLKTTRLDKTLQCDRRTDRQVSLASTAVGIASNADALKNLDVSAEKSRSAAQTMIICDKK